MTEEVFADACRFLYAGWEWRVVTKLLNRKHGTDYTVESLLTAFENAKVQRAAAARQARRAAVNATMAMKAARRGLHNKGGPDK